MDQKGNRARRFETTFCYTPSFAFDKVGGRMRIEEYSNTDLGHPRDGELMNVWYDYYGPGAKYWKDASDQLMIYSHSLPKKGSF